MKKFLLPLLLCGSAAVHAQTGLPQLLNVGIDTPITNVTAISPQGSLITWSYYEYCTNVTCFNDGLKLHTVDSNGNKIMTMQFEKPLSDFSTSSSIFLQDAAFDNEGNFYIAGRIHSNVIMSPNDPTPTILTGNTATSNSSDMFVAKYKVADGKIVWAKHMPMVGSGMSMVGFMHMAVDNDNNVYLEVLKTTGTFDLNPGASTNTASDNFIVKYNKDGAYMTHKPLEATISTQLRKTLHWQNNGLYMVTSVDSAGKQTMLLRQYDPATLNPVKTKKIGWFDENNNDNGYKKKIDVAFNQGNMWLMGTHVSSLHLPATSGTVTSSLGNSERGFFLAKLDANWNLTDARVLALSKSTPMAPMKIGFDGLNNLMVIGAFKDSMDFDLGPGKMTLEPLSSTYTSIGYMAYYNQNLDLQWAKTFGDTAGIYMYNAGFGNNKRIYVSGSLMGNGNFSLAAGSPSYSSHWGTWYSGFLARYMWPTANVTDVNDVDDKHTALLYPNPCTDELLIDMKDAHGAVQLSVYDVTGKLIILKTDAAGKRISIATGSLTPGMYYLKLQHGAHMEAHAFQKK